jgi:hypothetical protein
LGKAMERVRVARRPRRRCLRIAQGHNSACVCHTRGG